MSPHAPRTTQANDTRRPCFDDAFHRTIVDNIADGVYYVDRNRLITYWNHGAERLTGFAAADVVGRHCYANLLSHVDDTGKALCKDGCPLAATIADGEVREAEVWLRHQDGHRRAVSVRTAPIRGASAEIIGAVEVFDDASRLVEARSAADRARRDALTDQLTTLPNRRAFDDALGKRLDNLARYGWPFALVMADIDHFKHVNDSWGHEAGDAALRVVAASLAAGIRSGDMVARWGGEEFAVLLEDADGEIGRTTAERLRVLVARSRVRVADRDVRIRISLGVAVAALHDTPTQLLARADAALYAAKANGRNRVEVSPTPPSGVPG